MFFNDTKGLFRIIFAFSFQNMFYKSILEKYFQEDIKRKTCFFM